jgi:hypothetical protein
MRGVLYGFEVVLVQKSPVVTCHVFLIEASKRMYNMYDIQNRYFIVYISTKQIVRNYQKIVSGSVQDLNFLYDLCETGC